VRVSSEPDTLELPLVSDAASNIGRHGGIAASRFSRLDNDNYFTIDSPWIIPALMSKVPIAGSVLEPAAGLGHMVIELRGGHGLAVTASDLHAYPDPLIPDIAIRDLRAIDMLSGFNWAITNLPYRDQDVLAAHLVELGARDGCNVALLTRAEWIVAGARRQLVHHHPNFAGVVHLTSRPRWTETLLASPRHNFIWAVWSAEPRPPGVDAWARFADRRSP
jgi:hypothetical protein